MPSDRLSNAPTTRRRYLALAGAAVGASVGTAGCGGVAARVRAPRIEWRAQVEGRSVRPPLVRHEGRVLAMGEHDLVAIDAADGDRAWISRSTYFDRTFVGPVVADGVVVVGEDTHAGFRSGGERVWSREDSTFRPLDTVGGLALGASDREGAEIAAVDPADGTLAWGAAPDGWSNDGARAVRDAVAAGPGVVAVSANSRLAGVDADGSVRWTADAEWDTHGPGRPSLATDVSTVVAASGAVAGFDAATGERRWRRVLPDFATDVTVADGVAVVSVEGDTPKVDSWDEPGGVIAYDTDDGTERWRTPLDAPAAAPGTGLGSVVVGTEAGTLVGLDREDGAVEWRRPVGDAVHAPPVGGSDRLFVGVRRDGTAAVVRLDR